MLNMFLHSLPTCSLIKTNHCWWAPGFTDLWRFHNFFPRFLQILGEISCVWEETEWCLVCARRVAQDWGLVSVAEFWGNLSVSLVAPEFLQLLLTPLRSAQNLWTAEGVKDSKLLKSYSNVFFTLICAEVSCNKHWVDLKAPQSSPSKSGW